MAEPTPELIALVKKYTAGTSLSPGLVIERIRVESNFNPTVPGKAQQWRTGYGSEIGLLQLSPDTRKQYGITEAQAKDPETNIRIGVELWDNWASKYFRETTQRPPNQLARDAHAWLVTAVGPGAIRRIRKLVNNDYSVVALQRIAADTATLTANKAYWGTQSPGKIATRIKVAIKHAKAAVGYGGGTATTTLIGLVGLLYLASRLLTYT